MENLILQYLGRLKVSPVAGMSAGFLNTGDVLSPFGTGSSGGCGSSVLMLSSPSFSAATKRKTITY